jgi:tetratricopeptide (TPR) repeat protein
VSKIFISYRRSDSADISGRIHDRLVPHFGGGSVLMDISSIPAGADFREHIKELIQQSGILLAVIGPQWEGGDTPGIRRIDEPEDYVKLEIEQAIGKPLPIIPILVGGRAMPKPEQLPASLVSLAYRNAIEVRSGSGFPMDMEAVIKGIEVYIQRPQIEGPAKMAQEAVRRGDELLEQKHYELALKEYERAQALDTANVDAWAGKSLVLCELDRAKEALEASEHAIGLQFQHARAWFAKGAALWLMKHQDKALDALENALAIDPTLIDAWVGKGAILYEQGRTAESIKAIDQALKLDPTRQDIWIAKGNVLRAEKRYQEALETYDQALTKGDTTVIWLHKAATLHDEQRFAEALAAYEQILTSAPENIEAALGKGIELRALKRYDEALKTFEQVIESTPENATAWVGKGDILLDLKHPQEALAAYERAIDLNPQMLGAWEGKTSAHRELKQVGAMLASAAKTLLLDAEVRKSVEILLNWVAGRGEQLTEELQQARIARKALPMTEQADKRLNT